MQTPELAPQHQSRVRKPFSKLTRFASSNQAGRSLLALALLTQGFFFGAVAVQPAQAQKAVGYKGTPGTAASATVDVSTIALEDELAPESSNNEPRVIHRPMSPPTEGQLPASMGRGGMVGRQSTLSVPNADTPGAPLVPSPAPSTNFLGLTDNQQFIPPDTMGAVSERWVVTILNDRMRIQDRAGNVINTVSTGSFWLPLTYALAQPFDVFDPKIYYDRFSGRVINLNVANTPTPTTSLQLAVSPSEEPSGASNL
jgi:hypothetical protein